jgi:hypothetical protein
MSGYREDEFDPNAGETTDTAKRGSWWKTLLVTLGYMIPLLWLWNRTDFPDSLGIHITAHGKAGLLENWYYSYLLVERHHILDDVAFAYMWAPIVGLVGWFAARKLRRMKFSIYADDEAAR